MPGLTTGGTRSTWAASSPPAGSAEKVLDVGCWDGLWSFEAEKRGAAEVYSIDYVSLRAFSEQATYRLAHKLLGSRARYFPDLSVYDIDRVGVFDFDVVIYCGIYYHLNDPLRAFAALRNVMKEGAQMIVEGPVLDGSDRAFANFYARTWFAADPTNRWVPTMACLREWLDCTFFDVVTQFSAKAPAPRPPAPKWGPLRRLRRLFGAARRAAAGALEPAPDESQDRVSLVARATSVAERLAPRLRAPGLPPLLAAPGMTAEAVAGFCEAAIAFHRAAPWEHVRHDQMIELFCPAHVNEPMFLMVLGQGTAERGLAIHFQRPGFTLVVQGWLVGEQITWAPLLAALFSPSAELPAGEARTLTQHECFPPDGSYPFAVFNEGHGGTTRPPGSTLRRPGLGELRLLEACLRAVPGFVARHATEESAYDETSVTVAGSEVRMTLSWAVMGAREL